MTLLDFLFQFHLIRNCLSANLVPSLCLQFANVCSHLTVMTCCVVLIMRELSFNDDIFDTLMISSYTAYSESSVHRVASGGRVTRHYVKTCPLIHEMTGVMFVKNKCSHLRMFWSNSPHTL